MDLIELYNEKIQEKKQFGRVPDNLSVLQKKNSLRQHLTYYTGLGNSKLRTQSAGKIYGKNSDCQRYFIYDQIKVTKKGSRKQRNMSTSLTLRLAQANKYLQKYISAYELCPKSLASILQDYKGLRNQKQEQKYSLSQNDIELTHIRNQLLRSNGLHVTTAQWPYLYYLGPDDHDQLILETLQARNCWVRTQNIYEAQFIWTEVKERDIIKMLPAVKPKKFKQTIRNSPQRTDSFGLIQNSECFKWFKINKLIDTRWIKLYSKLDKNNQLCDKKSLFANICSNSQNPFSIIPLTFHISNGVKDAEFAKFQQYYNSAQNSIWIIKPGEATNRGKGIRVESNLDIIKELIDTTEEDQKRTYIIQKYIENPLLYKGRKFDIRCYVLLTNYNGNLQAYFYQDGYLRTASIPFMLSEISNKFGHLTNFAIQKYSTDFGKYEEGNKLSFAQFEKYLIEDLNLDVNFDQDILPQIKSLVTDSIKSVGQLLDPFRRQYCFEIIGYDIMIDNDLKAWLIEINTNPCIGLSSEYMSQLNPKMVNNAFQIALDTLFPPPNEDKLSFENRFELVYQELSRIHEEENLSLNKEMDRGDN